MKRIVKFIACALAASAMLLSFAACGSSETANSGSASTNMAKVGVIQYATHGSLDNCYQGFKEGLAEGGYVEGENLELFFKNANGETSTSDLIAKTSYRKSRFNWRHCNTGGDVCIWSYTIRRVNHQLYLQQFLTLFQQVWYNLWNLQVLILRVLVMYFR